MPSCTVAIPVYNRRDLVQRALQSALAQDLDDLDILVVDNCSDDGTWEALLAYHDPRLRLVRNERNVGLFGNFNRCLELAQGRYLRFLCSDDRLTPGCLRREVALMEQLPSAVLLSGRGRLVDEYGRGLGSQAYLLAPGLYAGKDAIAATLWCQLYYGKNILNYPSGVLLRTAAVQQAGLFDTTVRVVGDIDLFFRILGHGDLAVVDSINCEIMVHAEQEGSKPLMDGTMAHEIALLLQRFAGVLDANGTLETLNRQLSGWYLWVALKLWLEGAHQASQIHLRMARDSQKPSTAFAALVRIAWLRLLLRLYELRLLPLRPIERNEQRV